MADGSGGPAIANSADLTTVWETWTPSAIASWDVPTIRTAIDTHDDGDFSRSAALVDRMLRDPRVYGGLLQRALAAFDPELRVSPALRAWEGKPLALSIAAEARELFGPGGAVHRGVERAMLRGEIMSGYHLSQVLWDTREVQGGAVRWVPVEIKPWPSFAVRADRLTGRWQVRTKRGLVPIEPGDGKWLMHTRDVARPWIYGAVRPLGMTWADRTYALRDRSRRSTAAAGIGLHGTIPQGFDTDSPEARALMEQMAKLQQGRARVVTPTGYDIKPIKQDAAGHEIFESIIDCSDEDIAYALLGQTGTSRQKTGGLGDGGNQVHEGVRDDLTEDDVEALYLGTLTRQLLRPFALLNWGREELCPKVERLVPDPEDDDRLEAEAERSTAYRKELAELRALGLDVDPLELAEMRGVRLPEFREAPPTPPT